MNKWFQWLKQPINLPVIAEMDKMRLKSFQMQTDMANFKRAREGAFQKRTVA
jgi:hypothetical protein